MKLPSSTEAYLAMIPRRSSLVSSFGSGSESISSLMIAVVLSSSNSTGCSRHVAFMWIPQEVRVIATWRFMNLGMVDTVAVGGANEAPGIQGGWARHVIQTSLAQWRVL